MQEVVLNRKNAKNERFAWPLPISELDGAINKSSGVWGVLDKVFHLLEWFGHIMCVGCEI